MGAAKITSTVCCVPSGRDLPIVNWLGSHIIAAQLVVNAYVMDDKPIGSNSGPAHGLMFWRTRAR